MAHAELPQEELEPLLESIQEAFKPLQKAMPLIMKIPEEIKRVADNISQDLGSGIPEKVDNAVEKITQDEAEKQLFKELSEAEQEALEKLTEELQLLRENGIPAEIKEGKVTKLTEEQIKQTQKEFIQNVKEEKLIKQQIETVKKSDLTDTEQIKQLKTLTQKLKENTESRSEIQDKLTEDKVPTLKQVDSDDSAVPAFVEEPLAIGKETLMAGPNAIIGLKDSFINNIGKPLEKLLKANKKHHDVMEDYGETGEKADKLTILKFLAIAAGIAGILAAGSYIMNKLKGEKRKTSTEKAKEAEEKAYTEARKEGKTQEEALVLSQQAKQQATAYGRRRMDRIKDEDVEGLVEKQTRIAGQKKFVESETFQKLTGGSNFTEKEPVVNNYITTQNNQNTNSIETPVKAGASSVKTIAQG
tara:strand:- start:81 stop:1328 length:1248 start_codon:yes stop_codon:yes gene_type:complete